MTQSPATNHLLANRAYWDRRNAEFYDAAGQRMYSPEMRARPVWGVFGMPETEVGLLRDMADKDVVELGCGTGYVSAWCLDAGARSAVGVDNSPAQLATARRLQESSGVEFPLVFADAEHPPLRPASFDVAISEYGAAIWCDPYRWIPAAAQLLRPGGTLIFLGNSVLSMLCVQDYETDGPALPQLQRPQQDMHRFAFPDTDGVEFHISHGAMMRLLRDSGFVVEDLIELYATPDAATSYGFIDATWASQWPVEEAWVARLAG